MLSEHKPIAVAQLVVLALALVLVACGGDAEPTPADTPATTDTPAATTEPAPTTEAPPATPPTTVDWQNYAPDVQTRIDDIGQAKDCAGLQGEFDTADANDDAQRARVGGDGNADLMAYIDEWLTLAGCYE